MKRPLIIAHRGAPGRRLENTLAGFRQGIARGAEWVELDLHQTADGALVVWHDSTLGRKPVARLTLEEARALARRARGIALPTLPEVLETLPNHVGLNLEAKAPRIARAIVEVVARHHAADRVVCTSFDLPTVREFANLRPRLRTGVLTSRRLPHPVAAIRAARARALAQHFRHADEKLVRDVRAAGFAFFVWTVNRERDLRRMLALGVDAIVTDYPDRLVCLLASEAHR